jgi:hypothetical protein
MSAAFESFNKRSQDRHDLQVAAGEHDGECEYGPRLCRPLGRSDGPAGIVLIHMCHCSKRLREARGDTMLPGPVEWRSPTCPTCYGEVDGDGDSWACDTCHVTWGGDGETAEWSDVYGDLGQAVP